MLPEHLAAKDDPVLVAADEQHFAAVAASLEQQVADLSDRLDVLRRSPGGGGQGALDRDLEIHRLTAERRLLRRYSLDLCIGRMVGADDEEPVYIGRLGLADRTGRRLLVDWRAPAAEPFFAATHADPRGLRSRRRYRWTRGRITDFWDEVFTADGLEGHAALDDQSAFVASLGTSRSAQMRDVLGTIAADQDAIIRASSAGTLVVDGGPGTGKTVVALHRAAYLLYSDPRLRGRRGGVLVVGPHRPYLAYIADVLPSLGEEGVQTCTLRDLVPSTEAVPAETDPEVARLKSSVAMISAVEPAVRLYEEPPTRGLLVETELADRWISAADWVEAFESPDPGTPHNEALDQVRDALLSILVDDNADDDSDDDNSGVPAHLLRRAFAHSPELNAAVNRAWTVVEPADLIGDLWSVPAYLRRCAPWLTPEELRILQREDPQAWTVSDLPLLDAARLRLGDPQASRRRRQREATVAAERAAMERVIEDLVAGDDDGEGLVTMLRQPRIREMLVDDGALPTADPDRLEGPFAHIVVDEAQELTDAEWQMLLRRCPSRSFTVVGDRAQARRGFSESWTERLNRVGLTDAHVAPLTLNYRTPAEVMAKAEPLVRAAIPDANVPTSVRHSGNPVIHGRTTDLTAILDDWTTTHSEGVACVIGDPTFAATARVQSLTPETAKGLEFDLVVLVDPDAFGAGIQGAVDRYVAMTRATQQLVILTSTA
ncbi:RNA polymerase recycling motor ATPase HelR [Microlunatus lacustris]